MASSSLDALPANVMAERAVLGAILLDNVIYHEAAAELTADDFSLESHRRIFRRMAGLAEDAKPIDLITLAEEMGRERELERAGGIAYLSGLTEGIPRRSTIEHHVAILRDKSRRRQLLASGQWLMAQAGGSELNTDEILAGAHARLLEVGEDRGGGGLLAPEEIIQRTYGTVDAMYDRNKQVTGVQTGFQSFDEMTTGLQPGDLVIVAARPSMGKTAFACDVALHVAVEAGGVVAVFSLEMSRAALLGRMLCGRARLDSHRFRGGFLSREEKDRFFQAWEEVRGAKLRIDETGAIGLPEMRLRARRLGLEAKRLDLVVVDYLQLMRPPSSDGRGQANREQEVSAISRGLKALAKELQCPVLALSQLSRAPEIRRGEDRRPRLSDLRDSGAIEQDADVVAFLFREEVYRPREEKLRGKAELIVAKQRNGPTGTCYLAFLKSQTRFATRAPEDWETE